MNLSKGLKQSSATTLVLVVLRDGARHGYDIAREVLRRSDNVIAFNHGTLYPILYELEKSGKIQSQWEQPDGERRRRVYALTDAGRIEVEHAVKSWLDFSQAINKVIEGGGSAQPT